MAEDVARVEMSLMYKDGIADGVWAEHGEVF